MGVRIVHRPAVEPYPAVLDLNPISGEADDALDEVLVAVLWRNEHDDVSPVDRSEANEVAAIGDAWDAEAEDGVGDADAVGDLADEDMVADEQRRLHRARRYHVGLEDEGADEEGEDEGDEQRFGILAERGLSAQGRLDLSVRAGVEGPRGGFDGRGHSPTFSRARKAS